MVDLADPTSVAGATAALVSAPTLRNGSAIGGDGGNARRVGDGGDGGDTNAGGTPGAGGSGGTVAGHHGVAGHQL